MAVSIVGARIAPPAVSPAAIVTADAWVLAKGVVVASPLTMFCRFKVPDLGDRGLMAVIDAAGENGWRAYMFGGTLEAVQSRGPGGLNDYVNAGAPPLGVWNSMMFVSTDQLNFYLGLNGGTFVQTNAGGPLAAPPTQTIVGSSGTAGEVATFAIWNRAIPFAAFSALHRGVSPMLVGLPGLVYYAPMFGRSTPERCIFNGDLALSAGTSVWAPHPFALRPRRRSDYEHLTFSVPATDFSMSPTTGPGPLAVDGYDETLAGPSRAWNWERKTGAGAYETFSTEKYPKGISFAPGLSWDIRLTTSNPAGSHAREKLGYVASGALPPEPSSVISMGMGAGL